MVHLLLQNNVFSFPKQTLGHEICVRPLMFPSLFETTFKVNDAICQFRKKHIKIEQTIFKLVLRGGGLTFMTCTKQIVTDSENFVGCHQHFALPIFPLDCSRPLCEHK